MKNLALGLMLVAPALAAAAGFEVRMPMQGLVPPPVVESPGSPEAEPEVPATPEPEPEYASCLAAKLAKPAGADGEYRLLVNGVSMSAYCDMTTDGGGWTLVLNYTHKGGTNPPLAVLGDRLPIYSGAPFGSDEGASPTAWGHASPALMSALPGTELRFLCRTTPGTYLHFKNDDPSALAYFRTGNGGINLYTFRGDFVALPGHNAGTPLSADYGFGSQGGRAMTEFPFYQNAARHWSVSGQGNRFECDNFTYYSGPYANDTQHQIWLR